MDKYIGIDLGGTNIRGAIVDSNGNILGRRIEYKSHATEGTDAVIDDITNIIHELLSSQELDKQDRDNIRVGLAIPGYVDADKGVVKWSPNFGRYQGTEFICWRNIPVRSMLESRLKNTIVLGNDANLAALAEYRFGVGKNRSKCLIMLTLGTGIGSGIVLGTGSVQGVLSESVIFIGGNGGGAELGHVCIQPGGKHSVAGLYGTVESYCGKEGIVSRAIHKLRSSEHSIMRDMVENNIENITPRVIFDAAERGDSVALEVWQETGYYLGVLLGNCINIFTPDIIAIGGNISHAWKYMEKSALKQAKDGSVPVHYSSTKVVSANLIEDAGILGAAALAML